MKIIAHRGFSELYPENTLLAFRKAIEAGADGIETDLRLSLDEQIILFHDHNLKGITGFVKSPESLSLEVLKKLDVGEGESIASLAELLSLAEGKITLILEIKYNPKTYKKLCEILISQIENKLDWVEVSCFEDKVLKYMHGLNSDVKLHKLIDDISTLADEEMEVKYDYVSYYDIDVSLRKRALELGLIKNHKVIFWTVKKEDLNEEKNAGLYGIMVNNISKHMSEKG